MAFIFAVAGGFIRELASKKEQSPLKFLGGMCIGGFTGMIIFCICKHYNVEDYLTAAVVAIAGYAGLPILEVLTKILKRAILNQP